MIIYIYMNDYVFGYTRIFELWISLKKGRYAYGFAIYDNQQDIGNHCYLRNMAD